MFQFNSREWNFHYNSNLENYLEIQDLKMAHSQCKVEPAVSGTEVTEPCDTKLISKKTNEVEKDDFRFECTHCEKDFGRKQHLKMHIQSVHEGHTY